MPSDMEDRNIYQKGGNIMGDEHQGQSYFLHKQSQGNIQVVSNNMPQGMATVRDKSQGVSDGTQEDMQVCANTERISKNIYYQGALMAAQGRAKGQ